MPLRNKIEYRVFIAFITSMRLGKLQKNENKKKGSKPMYTKNNKRLVYNFSYCTKVGYVGTICFLPQIKLKISGESFGKFLWEAKKVPNLLVADVGSYGEYEKCLWFQRSRKCAFILASTLIW